MIEIQCARCGRAFSGPLHAEPVPYAPAIAPGTDPFEPQHWSDAIGSPYRQASATTDGKPIEFDGPAMNPSDLFDYVFDSEPPAIKPRARRGETGLLPQPHPNVACGNCGRKLGLLVDDTSEPHEMRFLRDRVRVVDCD